MRKEQLALTLAFAGVAIVGALAVALVALAPEKLGKALIGGLILPLLWSLVELATRGEKTSARAAVAASSVVVALFLGMRVAQAADWVGPDDARIGLKLFGIIGGLVLVFFGNRIPKILESFDPSMEDARRQAFQRMAGWVFVLAGLASALTWLILPVEAARLWATLIVGGATLFVLGRVARCWFRGRRA